MTDTPTEQIPQLPTPSAQTMVEKAEAAAKRIEEANRKSEELLKRQEEIEAKRILSGKSLVSAEPENLTDEQAMNKKAQQEANEIFKAFK